MFGRKSKLIDKYKREIEDLVIKMRTRDQIISEIRDIFGVPEGQDVRVFARAAVVAIQTHMNMLEGAANTIAKADKWFEEQLHHTKEKQSMVDSLHKLKKKRLTGFKSAKKK